MGCTRSSPVLEWPWWPWLGGKMPFWKNTTNKTREESVGACLRIANCDATNESLLTSRFTAKVSLEGNALDELNLGGEWRVGYIAECGSAQKQMQSTGITEWPQE